MTFKTASLGLVSVVIALLACKQNEKAAPAPASAATQVAAPAPTPSPTPAETATAETPAKPSVDEHGIQEIPSDRSNPPTVAEWSAAATVNTQGANSQAQDCFMKIVRESIKVHCEGEVKSISDKDRLPRCSTDYYEWIKTGKIADFMFRLKKSRTTKMRIHRDDDRANLCMNWLTSKRAPSTRRTVADQGVCATLLDHHGQ